MKANEFFRRFAHLAAEKVGSYWSFIMAIVLILAWLVTGPFFEYSDTWQLVINTTTTVITFLMVFIIQNSQNRDGHAMQLKLDELIRAQKEARNRLIDLEELSDEELARLQEEFRKLQKDS